VQQHKKMPVAGGRYRQRSTGRLTSGRRRESWGRFRCRISFRRTDHAEIREDEAITISRLLTTYDANVSMLTSDLK